MVLRFFGLASPILYRLDPVTGYEPRPDQTSSRLGVDVHINDAGLRDDESLATLLAAKTRVLVAGNSVTYGSSLVSQAELFTEVAERELRTDHPGLKVMNAGVAGYSATQIVTRARRLVERTKPQVLVLYFIRDDFRRLPMRSPDEDSPQEPQRPPALALATFTRLTVGYLTGRYRITERIPALGAILPKAKSHVVPPSDTARVIDLNLEAIRELVRRPDDGGRGPEVLAFISPSRAAVAENRASPNGDLVRRLEAIGIRARDLQPDFHRAMAGRDVSRFYHDEIHYRAEGNAVAGRVLAGYLRAALGTTAVEPGD